MSKTFKDEPYWVREFRKDPRYGYVPNDWRERTDWYRAPYEYDDPTTYHEWRAARPDSKGGWRYANWADSSPAFSAFRKNLNRSYRRAAKMKLDAGRWDEIPRPRRNARWFWW